MLAEARNPKARPGERIAALRDIADRGYGKAPAFSPMEGMDPLEVDAVAEEISRIADDLAAARAQRAA